MSHWSGSNSLSCATKQCLMGSDCRNYIFIASDESRSFEAKFHKWFFCCTEYINNDKNIHLFNLYTNLQVCRFEWMQEVFNSRPITTKKTTSQDCQSCFQTNNDWPERKNIHPIEALYKTRENAWYLWNLCNIWSLNFINFQCNL